MRRFCQRCLLYAGMRLWLHPRTVPDFCRPVRIDDEGVCSVCRAYERWSSPRLRASEAAEIERSEVRRAVVMFSGGKDSTATLVHTVRTLKFEAVAVLLDNGLIPPATLERARALCAALSVELEVLRPEGLKLLDGVSLEAETPCITCANHTVKGAYETAVRLKTPWIFQGTHYFAEWKMVPKGMLAGDYEGHALRHVNLPYVMGLQTVESTALLREVGYEAASMSGVSTNCRLPGIVQERLADELGHVPELEDLSLEVLVGHVTRAAALALLREKAPRHAALLDGA